MIGKKISHYKILEKLGGGGMGVVYKAQDEKLDRFAALKFLPPHLSADEEIKQRFIAEAKAASALDHTNICTVYEIDETDDDQMFIAMAFYDGETLKKKIELEPPTLLKSIKIAIQIAEGLSRAHAQGIIHRDIKPANIMVTSEGLIKILDFGLAKIADANITKTGWTLGTAAYMSPEQARADHVDNRSDIWSLGVILYVMVTGQSPFKGEKAETVIFSILNDKPKSPVSIKGDIPPKLGIIIERCLEKDRENRFSDMSELVDALNSVLLEISGLESSHSSLVASPLSKQKRTKMSYIWAVAIVVAIIVVTYFLVHLYKDSRMRGQMKIGRATQLTHSPGLEIDAVISPDGTMIAYAAGVEGEMDIYIRQISGGRAIPLTSDFPGNHRWPKWSPDGKQIAFQSSGNIFIIPALGGPPRLKVRGVTNPSIAWSPGGKTLAYVSSNRIHIQSLDGSSSTELLEAYDPHSLNFSPDGAFLVYVSGNPNFLIGNIIGNIAPSSLWIIPSAGGEPVRIRDDTHMNMSPLWTPDGKHLLFTSDQDGSRDIFLQSLSTSAAPIGPPERLSTGLDAHTIDLSKDGTFLVYSKFNQKRNIWFVKIPETEPVGAADALPVTVGNQVIEGLHVSQDGEWIMFDSNLSGNQDIYKMPVAGGDPVQLTTHSSNDYYPVLSPDGTEVAFYSLRNGNRDVFVMSLEGGSLQQVTFHTADDIEPDWSSDGNQIVFFSYRTGQSEIFIVSRAENNSKWGAPRQITFEGGQHAKWSPDGRFITYVSFGKLILYSIEQETLRVLFFSDDLEKIPQPMYLDWSLDSQSIFYKGYSPDWRSSFWSIPISGGTPKSIARFVDPSRSSNRSEFTSDGRRLFFTLTEKESDIWQLEFLKDK